jgi:hypothetical protein
MKHLAHVDAAGDELGARRLDVGHDEEDAKRRSRRGRRQPLAEMDRGGRAGRSELDGAEGVADDEVGVESPAELAIEPLGAIDIRNRDDDDLELHVDGARRSVRDRSLAGLQGFCCVRHCSSFRVSWCCLDRLLREV